jgi:hypothetical protein
MEGLGRLSDAKIDEYVPRMHADRTEMQKMEPTL